MSSKVNDDWQKLFDKYDILNRVKEDGCFNISADQIKEFHEPRLMTKFDWKSARPAIFQENGLSILPNTRGTYVIGPFLAYKTLELQEQRPKPVSLPSWMQTFSEFEVTSESVALNVAKASGMISEVLNAELDEPQETITGRLKSGVIEYSIDTVGQKEKYDFHVDNSQVEIDAGYETRDNLAVIEAKTKIPDDFMIRQLYYPYTVYNKLGTGKNVIPIYMTYTDDVYRFYVFKFTDPANYSSIQKVKQYDFILSEHLELSIEDVKEISRNSPQTIDTGVPPFPQADKISRVLDLLNRLYDGPLSKDTITSEYGFDSRQTDYYFNALRYLGLAEKSNNKIILTRDGKEISKLPNSDLRNKLIIEKILEHYVFKKVFDDYMQNGGQFDDEHLVELIEKGVANVNETTANRRKGTVKSWINWIVSMTDQY